LNGKILTTEFPGILPHSFYMNMLKINIAIVHGIGINTQGYAEPLIKGVRKQFNRALQDILKTSNDYADQLNFIPVIWDDIVAYQGGRACQYLSRRV